MRRAPRQSYIHYLCEIFLTNLCSNNLMPGNHQEHTAPLKHTPPWLFFLLSTPGGVFAWGVRALLVPYLLRKNGVPVDRIAEVLAIASLPTMWSFATAPAIDIGLRRSTWILLTSAILAISTFVTITHAGGSLVLLTALMFS